MCYNVYQSNIITVIKARRVRWACNLNERKILIKFWPENLKVRPLWGSKRKRDNIKTGSERKRTWNWVHLGQGTVANCCEQDNESSSYITGRKFLDSEQLMCWLQSYVLLMTFPLLWMERMLVFIYCDLCNDFVSIDYIALNDRMINE
jgi:hypothetical protein